MKQWFQFDMKHVTLHLYDSTACICHTNFIITTQVVSIVSIGIMQYNSVDVIIIMILIENLLLTIQNLSAIHRFIVIIEN